MKWVYALLILVMIQAVSAAYLVGSYCHQETANASTASDGNCNLNYTGKYYVSLSADGYYFNYSKPINTGFLNLLNIKTGSYESNVSIPSSCWNAYPTKLVFKMLSYVSGSFPDVIIDGAYCYDSANWIPIKNGTSAVYGGNPGDNKFQYLYDGDYSTGAAYENGWLSTDIYQSIWTIYEESMYWFVPQFNITYPSNGNWYNNDTLSVNTNIFLAASCWFSNDKGVTNISTDCSSVSGYTWNQGQNNVTIWANDTFGNVISNNISFNIDSIAPVIIEYSSIFDENSIIVGTLLDQRVFEDDNLQFAQMTIDGTAYWTYDVYYNGSSTSELGTIDVEANTLTPGWHTYAAYATDIAGNRADVNLTNPSFLDTNQFRTISVVLSTFPLTLYSGQLFSWSAIGDITGAGLQSPDFNSGMGYYFPDIGQYATMTKTSSLTSVGWYGTQKAPIVSAETNYSYVAANLGMNISRDSPYLSEYDTLFIVTEQTIYPINVSTNCSNPSVIFNAKDEVYASATPTLTFSMNIDITVYPNIYGANDSVNFHYELSGANNYSICLNPYYGDLQMDAIIEYSATNYSKRKYFLLNATLGNTAQNVTLYLLPEDISTDVVYTTIEDKTANIVPEAYIKIFRYYPGENLYRLVEVEKTDANGKTVGKVVLADVWYKYVVEQPAGTVRLATSIEKVTSGTRTLILSSSVPNLDDINEKIGIIYDVSCTKSTKTCRFTWDNPKNTDVTGKLNIYVDNGWTKSLLYNASASLAAGTLVYTITEDTAGKTYSAQGVIVS